MANRRLIARLDIKNPNLIKGIHLEGLRVIGDPKEYATKYYNDGIDEIIYMDSVASLYGRNHLSELVTKTAENIFVPLTVGGGIRSLDNVRELLRAGADKVAINTAAVKNPILITQVAQQFGSQCMVLSVEAKATKDGSWEVYIDNGREKTGLDVIEWVEEGVALGAGELLLTSVDKEGTRKGFDLNLIKAVSEVVDVPVIASGGMGNAEHLVEVYRTGKADAAAIADALHYNRYTLSQLKDYAKQFGINLRKDEK